LRAPTLIFAFDTVALALVVVVAPAGLALLACAPAGVLGVVACELLDRKARTATTLRDEPWRLDGWMVLVGTLATLGLGAAIGGDAVAVVWLLVALLGGLGFASLPNLAPRSRP
jgi:hypothetical protein